MDLTYESVKKTLNDHRPEFHERFLISGQLIDALKQKKIIGTGTHDKLSAQNLTDHRKIDIILDCIIAKGRIAFLAFCDFLCDEKIDQSHLVTEVLGLSVEYVQQQRDLMVTVSLSDISVRGPEGGNASQMDTEDIKKCLEKKFLSLIKDETIKLEEKSRCNQRTDSDIDAFNKFVKSLCQSREALVAAFYKSVVFIIRCPDVVSMLDLQEKCNSGELAHGAEEIFMSDAFKEFNLEHVKVSVAVDLEDVESEGVQGVLPSFPTTHILPPPYITDRQGCSTAEGGPTHQPIRPKDFPNKGDRTHLEGTSQHIPRMSQADGKEASAKMKSPDEAYIYPEDLKTTLKDQDLGWYADNPCYSTEKMQEYIDLGLDTPKLLTLLEKQKDKIEDTIKGYSISEREIELKPPGAELRCLLLGKTGAGKSSLGNLLLGEKTFGAAGTATSVTHHVEYGSSKDLNIKIIDTPGFADSEGTDVDTELGKIFTIFKEGLHAFIFVMNISNPRVTQEGLTVISEIQNYFGEEMNKYMHVVLSRPDAYFKGEGVSTLKDYVSNMVETGIDRGVLRNVVAVENTAGGYMRSLSRQAVVDLIWDSVISSGGKCYTSELQKEMKEEMAKQKKEMAKEMNDLKDTIASLVSTRFAKMDIGSLGEMLETSDAKDVHKFVTDNISIKVSGLSEHEYDAKVRLITQRTIGDLGPHIMQEKLGKLMREEIKNPEEDAMKLLEYYKRGYSHAVQTVGEDDVKDCINARIADLKQTAEERRKKNKVFEFIMKHISLHDDVDRIQKHLADEDEAFRGIEMTACIENCLKQNEIKRAIHLYKKSQVEDLVQENIDDCVASFICKKSLGDFVDCEKNENLLQEYVKELIGNVKRDLPSNVFQFFDDVDLETDIRQTLQVTCKNVSNESFLRTLKIKFSILLSANWAKELLKSVVQKGKKPKQ